MFDVDIALYTIVLNPNCASYIVSSMLVTVRVGGGGSGIVLLLFDYYIILLLS